MLVGKTQPDCKHPAEKPQKSKLPREEIDSCNPSLALQLPESEQRAVVFSPEERLCVQNGKQSLRVAPAGMRPACSSRAPGGGGLRAQQV